MAKPVTVDGRKSTVIRFTRRMHKPTSTYNKDLRKARYILLRDRLRGILAKH